MAAFVSGISGRYFASFVDVSLVVVDFRWRLPFESLALSPVVVLPVELRQLALEVIRRCEPDTLPSNP
jgi:hypothetical protein